MNNTNNNGSCNCICEILNVILVLQENACPENCLDTCDRPMLGGGPNCLICNTRPVMVYTCCGNGTPWEMPTTKDPVEGGETSNIFRVEKVENGCCTFRVLVANTDPTATSQYTATNSFFTMSCDCICAIRCLSDGYVEGVC